MAGSHLKLEIEGRLGAGSARNSPTSPFQGLPSLKQVWVSLEMSKRASKWLQKAGSSGVQVLDEADRLLNEDFEKAIDKILEAIPRERKTYLFSATMTKK
ncbi:hypothetical protein C3L33_23319, partial [Rhododendron williamsianum]